jgi:hypothetical protein
VIEMGTHVKVKLLKAQRGKYGEHLPKGSIIDATLVDPSTIQFGFFQINPKETCLMSGKAYKQFFGKIYDSEMQACGKTKWTD